MVIHKEPERLALTVKRWWNTFLSLILCTYQIQNAGASILCLALKRLQLKEIELAGASGGVVRVGLFPCIPWKSSFRILIVSCWCYKSLFCFCQIQ